MCNFVSFNTKDITEVVNPLTYNVTCHTSCNVNGVLNIEAGVVALIKITKYVKLKYSRTAIDVLIPELTRKLSSDVMQLVVR